MGSSSMKTQQRYTLVNRIRRYSLGLGSLAIAIASGSQLAVGLLAGLYCLRRLRAFRGIMS
ncbi:hypothetical protein [Bacterioplanoides sp.]|uniref:hypothetical protein n=1 Tax=Bacterioplanoides sp. TaxID=2066072 RepID=UPI003B59F817